jgi:hypothetical protein
MLVTAEVSQDPIGWLKSFARENMDCMFGCSFESAPNLASQEGIGLRGTPRKAWKKPAGCVSCDEDR